MLAVGLVGFPIGGFLYELTPGPATPLLADVLLFTVASTFALAIRGAVRPGPRTTPRPVASSPTDGGPPTLSMEAVDTRLPPATRPLLASAALASLAASGLLGLLVLFATDDLGLGAPAFGMLLAGLAASTAIGGYVAPTIAARIGVRAGLTLGLVVAGAAVATASAVADPARPWIAAVALGVSAAAGMAANVLVRAGLQLAAGRQGAARTLDRLHLLLWSAIPVGALLAGWTARHLPVHRVLAGCGLAWVAAATIVVVASRVRTAAITRPRPTAIARKTPIREIV
jgi:hypothetical protein